MNTGIDVITYYEINTGLAIAGDQTSFAGAKAEFVDSNFDRFLDKPDPLLAVRVSRLAVSTDDLLAVRVVSHHMRLLGVLVERENASHLVVVDYDYTKGV